MQVQGFAGIPLDISDFPTRHNYGLALWQSHFERILADWVDELGVPILRGREVVGFTPGRHRRRRRAGPTARRCERSTSSGATADAAWSARQPASISPAWIPSTSFMIAEVEMTEQPEIGMRREGGGIGPVEPGGGGGALPRRAQEQHVDHTGDAHPATTSARRSSPPTGPTSGCTARPGSPASPTCPPGRLLPPRPGAARR